MFIEHKLTRLSAAGMLALALAACGGGGSSDSGKSASDPVVNPADNANTPVPAATVTALLQSGLFQVSYGGGQLEDGAGVDHGIAVAQLGNSVGTSEQLITTGAYAGNAAATFNPLVDAVFPVFDGAPSTANRSQMVATFNTATGVLSVWNDASRGKLASTWQVSWTQTSLAGKSLNDYLSSNMQHTAFDTTKPVSGTFPAGATGYRMSYIPLQETYLQEGYHSDGATSFAGLSNTHGGDGETWVTEEYLANGVFAVYDGRNDAGSTTGLPFLGNGSWSEQVRGNIKFIETVYPSGAVAERADNNFSAATYDAGVRRADFWDPSTGAFQGPKTGSYSVYGFVIPKGVAIPSTNLLLNKTAADAVKQATGM